MKKIIRMSESDLVGLIKKILSETPIKNQKVFREQFDFTDLEDYGKAGKMCVQKVRTKGNNIIDGPVVNCDQLDSNGFLKQEIARDTNKRLGNSQAIYFLIDLWKYKYKAPGVTRRKSGDIDLIAKFWTDKASFDSFVNEFNKKVNSFAFDQGVQKPSFGEALAWWVNVGESKSNFEPLKQLLDSIGVPSSIGKSASGNPEIIFGSSSNSGQVNKNKFCVTGYKSCSNTYQACCNSQKIAQVQRCLGISNPDGKWGPMTQNKLKAKFPQFAQSFTDDDVATICGKK